ncbi:MAG: hypothetical protein ACLR0U_05100 [Enterocloster clostridioformis]
MDSLAIPQDFSVEDNGHMVVKAAGKTAHAAFPEGSDSAAVRLARVMPEPLPDREGKSLLRFPD